MTTSPRVLIIDDSETMRRSVVDTLEPHGYAVSTAPDAIRGIAALKEARDLCLVIIDLNMPGISGFGVLEWMRKDASPHLPPAVFMTTEVNNAVLEQAKKAGAAGWLVKPCKPEQLLTVVERILKRRGDQRGS